MALRFQCMSEIGGGIVFGDGDRVCLPGACFWLVQGAVAGLGPVGFKCREQSI